MLPPAPSPRLGRLPQAAPPGVLAAAALGALAVLGILVALAGCGEETPAGPATGRLSGRVVLNLTSEPLAGVTVTGAGRTLTTGPDGLFEFKALPRGTIELRAEKPDFRPRTWTVALGASAYVSISLVPVDSTADVSGTVSHRFDGPVAGAEVRLAGQVLVSGPDGSWAAADVPLGLHDVVVSHPGYLPLSVGIVAAHPQEILPLRVFRLETRTLGLARDTEVRRTLADLERNFGAAPTVAAGAKTGSLALLGLPDQEALAQFAATVEWAVLRLRVRRQFPSEWPADSPSCLRILTVSERWGEMFVTGADSLGENRLSPLFDFTGDDCWEPLGRTWRPVELDVSVHLAEILAGWPNFGLLVEHVPIADMFDSGGLEIATRENPDPDVRPVVVMRVRI